MSEPMERNFEFPEAHPDLQEIIPDAVPDRSRHDLPIPPDLVDDLIRKIDDGTMDTEDDKPSSPPTIH